MTRQMGINLESTASGGVDWYLRPNYSKLLQEGWTWRRAKP